VILSEPAVSLSESLDNWLSGADIDWSEAVWVTSEQSEVLENKQIILKVSDFQNKL